MSVDWSAFTSKAEALTSFLQRYATSQGHHLSHHNSDLSDPSVYMMSRTPAAKSANMHIHDARMLSESLPRPLNSLSEFAHRENPWLTNECLYTPLHNVSPPANNKQNSLLDRVPQQKCGSSFLIRNTC